MNTEIKYFNEERETLSADQLAQLQLSGFRNTITQALKSGFYSDWLQKKQIKSAEDINNLKDIQKLPFTVKQDLRDSYPDRLLAVQMQDVVRIHTSSGTTGMPTVIYHTSQDLKTWTELMARSIIAAGGTQQDVFQNMTGYGLFTGGLGLHYGAEQIGMCIIPSGAGNTKRQVQLMKDFKTTVLHSIPSYLLHVYDYLQSENICVSDLYLQKAFVGAEAYSENVRRKLENLFKIDVYNSYGLSEMNGPGVSFECIYKTGMHTWEDAFYMEIIDPESGELVEDGESGELVFTTLCREATPLIRYRTGDIASVMPGKCRCGRIHRRISRIEGRTDDMIIINGVNIFPIQIEALLMKYPEFGNNYQILINNKGALDHLVIRTEIAEGQKINTMLNSGFRDNVISDFRSALLITPGLELLSSGSLPTAKGKAVRVFDNRKNI